MVRRRYTISITDEIMAAHLDEQGNISEYVRTLIEADMMKKGERSALPPAREEGNNDTLNAILGELRGLRQDLNGKAIVTVPDTSSTRRREPGGLARQVGKFREGQR